MISTEPNFVGTVPPPVTTKTAYVNIRKNDAVLETCKSNTVTEVRTYSVNDSGTLKEYKLTITTTNVCEIK